MRKQAAGFLALVMLMVCIASRAEAGVSAGNTVIFGKYWQHMKTTTEPADPEPVSWKVLAVEGDKALLLAEQPLVGMAYNSDEHFLYEVTWEIFRLRAWLNGVFLDDAFSAEEKRAILPTLVSTPDFVGNGLTVSGGNDTTDLVFLLSVGELEKYLRTDESRKCCPTDYALNTGAVSRWGTYSDDSRKVDTFVDGVSIWWLRSPGKIGHYAAYCNYTGDIRQDGSYVAESKFCVRPALWVRTSALASGN